MAVSTEALLDIRNLCMEFSTYQGTSKVLDNVSLTVRPGEIVGVVGETGCGKSVTARSVLRLIPEPPGRITRGEIFFRDQDVLKLSKKQLRRIRGNRISMIFQEPMSSLNPVFTVGNQMREVVRLHQRVDRAKAHDLCVQMLRQVKLPDPEEIMGKYPHELSGGMRQRVMIAMELSCQPDLLIADEPTTALDVTVQGQVLGILSELTRENNVSVLFITHDMGVVAQLCDRVAVMYAGQIAETALVHDIFSKPKHPYTQGLIAAITGLEAEVEYLDSIPGFVPDLFDPPPGCRFQDRCARSLDECRAGVPELIRVEPEHDVACYLYGRAGAM